MAACLTTRICSLAIGFALVAASDRVLGQAQGSAPWISSDDYGVKPASDSSNPRSKATRSSRPT